MPKTTSFVHHLLTSTNGNAGAADNVYFDFSSKMGLHFIISCDSGGDHADATLIDGTKAGNTFQVGAIFVPRAGRSFFCGGSQRNFIYLCYYRSKHFSN